jgi:hypothetical protein
MLWFGAFIALVVLLMLWALVIAPARTRKIFARLEAQGWERVASGDEALQSALDALRPFDLMAHRPDGGPNILDATVVSALARSGPDGTLYLVQLRVIAQDWEYANDVSHKTLVIQARGLPASSAYVLAGDREARFPRAIKDLGLRRADAGLDLGFAGAFLCLEGPGSSVRLPSGLQQALLASVDLFIYGAGERGRYLPNVCLRLSSSAWALVVPEPIVTDRQMRAALETADRVSRGLSGS